MEQKNDKTASKHQDNKHLFLLSELDDYRVASGNPDVRGWTLVDTDRQKLGTINGLIVDVDKEKVRYLDVQPMADTFTEGTRHRLLIPIGIARIDDKNKCVVANELDKDRLQNLPPHQGGAIRRAYEYEIVEKFNSPAVSGKENTDTDDDFYDHRLYNEENFYKRDEERKV